MPCLTDRKIDLTLMSISRSQSATSSSCNCFTCTTPAQLTTICNPPSSRTVASIESRTASSRRTPLLREIQHPLTRRPADVAEQFVRPRDAVRREQDVLQFAQALGRGNGLLREAVQRRAGDAIFFQRRIQRLLVHDPPAGAV